MSSQYPDISVVIPTYNEEKHIKNCLDSLLAQSYGGGIKIIVADGMSEDNTRSIIHCYIAEGHDIDLLDNPKRFQAAGRNTAIMHADTELICYIDGHSYASPDWIEKLYAAYKDLKHSVPKLAGIGSIHKDAAENDFTRASTVAFNSVAGGAGASSFSEKSERTSVPTAYACLYDRKVLDETGLYTEELQAGEDLELNLRITEKFGYKLYVEPKAVTYYYKRDNLKAFYKQMFSYGYWRFEVMKSLSSYVPATFIPALLTLYVLLSIILSALSAEYMTFFIATILMYITGIAVYSMYLSKNSGCRPWLLIKIFFGIHYSYGLGFLTSLLGLKL